MDRLDIEGSSVLKGATYEADRYLLTVTFLNGKAYNYYNVPASIWKAFRESPSKGKFFVSTIKGRFGEGSR